MGLPLTDIMTRTTVIPAQTLLGLDSDTSVSYTHLVFKALGASPTAMSWSEVFTAIQQKTIDGQENGTDTYMFFVDNGYSGLTAERPAFQNLLAAIHELSLIHI